MADITKEVNLEVTADLGKLRRAMKQAASFQKDMRRTSKAMRKEGLRGYKDLAKVSGIVSKQDKSRFGREALRAERQLQSAIKKTVKAIRDKAKASDDAARATAKEHAQLKRLTSELQKMRGARRGLGITSWGERARGVAGTTGDYAKGMLKGLLSGLGDALTIAGTKIAGGLLGVVTSQMQQAYAARLQYGQAYGQLAGLGGRGQGKATIDRARGLGVRMGFDPSAVAGIAGATARATGRLGGTDLTTAMQFMRATGMDIGGTANIMGGLARGGAGTGRTRQEMQKMLAMGMETGLKRARMPEFFQAMTGLVNRQASVMAGDVSAMPAARLLAQMQMSKLSGLTGARGGAALAQLDAAIRKPGGGEAGQALMLQAFGFGKPGGTATYYEALKRQEQGIFGAGNAQAMFAEARRQYGGGEAAILALREMTGLSISQLEALRDVVDSNVSSEEMQEQILRLEQEAGKKGGRFDLGREATKQMKAFGDTTKRLAHLTNRLVNIGDKLKKPIENIQDHINNLVEELTPTIVSALKFISDKLDDVANMLKEHFAPGKMESRAKKEADELIEQIEAGELTPEQALRRVRQMERRDKKILEDRPWYERLLTAINPFADDPEDDYRAARWERMRAQIAAHLHRGPDDPDPDNPGFTMSGDRLPTPEWLGGPSRDPHGILRGEHDPSVIGGPAWERLGREGQIGLLSPEAARRGIDPVEFHAQVIAQLQAQQQQIADQLRESNNRGPSENQRPVVPDTSGGSGP